MSYIVVAKPKHQALTGSGATGTDTVNTLLNVGAVVGLGVLFWYLYKTSAKERDESYRMRYATNPGRRGSYYVRLVGAGGRVAATYGPYNLSSAKSFARIGSQSGRYERHVIKQPGGKLVRKYRAGQRIWPVTSAQASRLGPRERPRKIAANPRDYYFTTTYPKVPTLYSVRVTLPMQWTEGNLTMQVHGSEWITRAVQQEAPTSEVTVIYDDRVTSPQVKAIEKSTSIHQPWLADGVMEVVQAASVSPAFRLQG